MAKKNVEKVAKTTAKAAYQKVVVEPAKAVYKATQAASQNLSNNSSALKESGSAGNAFANFSKGILDTVENTAAGIYNLANDPLGTVAESVNYLRQDPIGHSFIGATYNYYKDVAQASYAHDWDTVEYKLGSGLINLAGFAAVGGKTESVVKSKFPNGISLKNIPVPQVVMADTGLGIVPVITTVPVSATIPSAVVAGAAGVANAAAAQNIVYSKTLAGQSDSKSSSSTELKRYSDASNRYNRTGYTSGNQSSNLFAKDKLANSTQNITEWRRSIDKSEISKERRLFLGDDYVKIDSGKWRSLDGKRQFRVKPGDYKGGHGIGDPLVPNIPHVHFEFLEPRGNKFRVKKNIHVPLK